MAAPCHRVADGATEIGWPRQLGSNDHGRPCSGPVGTTTSWTVPDTSDQRPEYQPVEPIHRPVELHHEGRRFHAVDPAATAEGHRGQRAIDIRDRTEFVQ